jgi:hypothetical protein
MKIILILFISLNILYANQYNDYKLNNLKTTIKLLDNIKTESKGIKQLQEMIIKNPENIRKNYKKLYLQINNGSYKNILHQGYNRILELCYFKAMAKKNQIINSYMQDYAIKYIFFQSKPKNMVKLLPFIKYFDNLINLSKVNNTKTNQELLAIFKANYLISQNKEDDAYKLLIKNNPFHQKALMTLSYFSSIKDIPLFKNKEKLKKIIPKVHIKAIGLDYNPLFFVDFNCNKIKN